MLGSEDVRNERVLETMGLKEPPEYVVKEDLPIDTYENPPAEDTKLNDINGVRASCPQCGWNKLYYSFRGLYLIEEFLADLAEIKKENGIRQNPFFTNDKIDEKIEKWEAKK